MADWQEIDLDPAYREPQGPSGGRVQTRSEINDLAFFDTVAEAFEHARTDGTVWKISWTDGADRVRLVRSGVPGGGWDYCPLMEEVEVLTSEAPERAQGTIAVEDGVGEGDLPDTPTSEICGWCGMTPASGWAVIENVRFCHGDDDRRPTCYVRAQPYYYARMRPEGESPFKTARPSTVADWEKIRSAERVVSADEAIDGVIGTYEVGE
jgi:hypothetical protein